MDAHAPMTEKYPTPERKTTATEPLFGAFRGPPKLRRAGLLPVPSGGRDGTCDNCPRSAARPLSLRLRNPAVRIASSADTDAAEGVNNSARQRVQRFDRRCRHRSHSRRAGWTTWQRSPLTPVAAIGQSLLPGLSCTGVLTLFCLGWRAYIGVPICANRSTPSVVQRANQSGPTVPPGSLVHWRSSWPLSAESRKTPRHPKTNRSARTLSAESRSRSYQLLDSATSQLTRPLRSLRQTTLMSQCVHCLIRAILNEREYTLLRAFCKRKLPATPQLRRSFFQQRKPFPAADLRLAENAVRIGRGAFDGDHRPRKTDLIRVPTFAASEDTSSRPPWNASAILAASFAKPCPRCLP